MKVRQTSSDRWKGMLEPLFDADGVQATSGLDEKGREIPDPVPMSPPVGYTPPTELMTLIENVVRNREFLAALAKAEAETFEEADDFEVDEDYDPRFERTIYEEYFEAKMRKKEEERRAPPPEQVTQPGAPGSDSRVPAPGGNPNSEREAGDAEPRVAPSSPSIPDRSGRKSGKS